MLFSAKVLVRLTEVYAQCSNMSTCSEKNGSSYKSSEKNQLLCVVIGSASVLMLVNGWKFHIVKDNRSDVILYSEK
jgi:hypothetical protein